MISLSAGQKGQFSGLFGNSMAEKRLAFWLDQSSSAVSPSALTVPEIAPRQLYSLSGASVVRRLAVRTEGDLCETAQKTSQEEAHQASTR